MNIIIYDNKNLERLKPFSVNHSPIELRLGAFTNFNRIKNAFNKDDNLILIVREEIENLIKEKFSEYSVNPDIVPRGICLNSSAIISDNDINLINEKQNLANNGKLVSFYLDKEVLLKQFIGLDKNRKVLKDYLKKKLTLTCSEINDPNC